MTYELSCIRILTANEQNKQNTLRLVIIVLGFNALFYKISVKWIFVEMVSKVYSRSSVGDKFKCNSFSITKYFSACTLSSYWLLNIRFLEAPLFFIKEGCTFFATLPIESAIHFLFSCLRWLQAQSLKIQEKPWVRTTKLSQVNL